MARDDGELYASNGKILDEELIWQLNAGINVYEDLAEGDLVGAHD